jgi:hypothetical protein
MSERDPPGGVIVPVTPADVEPVRAAGIARARGSALVPGEAFVDAGASMPQTASFTFAAGAVVQTTYFSAILARIGNPDAVLVWNLAAIGLLCVPALRTAVRGWRLGRSVNRAPVFLPGPDQRGRTVRLQGVVQRSEGPLRTLRGQPAVLIRYQGCRGTARGPGWTSLWRWDLHAVGFSVLAEDGRELWVDPGALVLLPHPPERNREFVHRRRPLYQQATGHRGGPLSWIYDEEVIAPGDRVEVVGTLDLVPHPDAAASSDRQARLRPILRGTSSEPVRVRRHFPSLG